jgi:hypothetical protein
MSHDDVDDANGGGGEDEMNAATDAHDDVADGAGCAEIWERLSRRRREGSE